MRGCYITGLSADGVSGSRIRVGKVSQVCDSGGGHWVWWALSEALKQREGQRSTTPDRDKLVHFIFVLIFSFL